MKLPPPRLRRWLAWLAFAALWTAALLVPIPTHPLTLADAHPDLRFSVAKTVHVLAYAAFAVLTGRLGVRARLRWLPLFVVMAHAPASELLQQLTATRTGTLRDVGFDHLGVALGLLVSWKWWSAPDPAPERFPDEEAVSAAWRE
jgi:VanZ family protein